MNLCILIGKIVSDIEINFILNSKNISIAIFNLEVEQNNILTVKAYDEIANWCYQNLIKNDMIEIEGSIDSKMNIIINDCNISELS